MWIHFKLKISSLLSQSKSLPEPAHQQTILKASDNAIKGTAGTIHKKSKQNVHNENKLRQLRSVPLSRV